MRPPGRRRSAWIAAVGQHGILRHRLALQVLAALLLFGLLYRARLYYALSGHGVRPLGFRPSAYSLVFLSKYYWGELLVALIFAQATWVAQTAVETLRRPRVRVAARVFGLVLLHVAFAAIAIICQSHLSLMFSMNVGLSYEAMVEGLTAGGFGESFRLIRWVDYLFLLSPWLLLWGLVALPDRIDRYRNRAAAALALVSTLALVLQPGRGSPAVPLAIRRSPVWFTALDTLRTRRGRGGFSIAPAKLAGAPRPALAARTKGAPPVAPRPPAQRRSVQLVDPLFVVPKLLSRGVHGADGGAVPKVSGAKPAPAGADRRWNLVVVVMESVGARYLFRVSDRRLPPHMRARVPMPFVQRLSRRATFLANHYSPSNSSARSVFSIFSGMYPMPEVAMFSTKRRTILPSLFSLLPRDYQRFLVSPASLSWYFPRYYLRASGLEEMYGLRRLKQVKLRHTGMARTRDEPETTGFFIRRMARAKEPFVGVYVSFVAHYPYPDYGGEYRLLPPTRNYHRYLNNLRLLDRQIERIVGGLESTGRMERTIVMLVGDHGEAFGQHKGNWTHSRWSYNENFQTPAILYQPALFSPRRVERLTLHIDLLPTLLDAMRLSYNPRLLQGESLLQPELRRRYAFLYGNENTLSAIGRDGMKVQLSFKFRRCWAYDLASDPDERRRLGCKRVRAQAAAVLRFHAYQRRMLRDYVAQYGADGAFYGERHPRGGRR